MIGNRPFSKSSSENTISVSNVAEMKALTIKKDKTFIETGGYYELNDKGSARYYFDKSSVEESDDFTIIEPINNIGRFKLLFTDEINIATSGVKGNGIDDDLLKIQKAIDIVAQKGGGKVLFNNGVYSVSNTIELKEHVKLVSNSERQVYLPLSKPEIRALNSFPAKKAMINLGDGVDNRRGMQIIGLTINANLYAERGINFSDTIQNEIKDNLFLKLKTDGVALWGGGALYLNIENNSFSTGNWYALDAQLNYAYNTVGHYYGINVGNFSKNMVNCSYGIRHEGILEIYENDFEFTVNSRGAIDINSANANSYVNIFNNYFELKEGSTYLTAIRCSANNGSIIGNKINGQSQAIANSLAIDIGSNYSYAINIHSNSLQRWETGIKSFSSTNGHGDNLANYTIGSNLFKFVTTLVSSSTNSNVVASLTNANDYRHTAQIINKANHHAFQNSISLGQCSVNYSIATKLNLVKGNVIKIIDASAVTISTVTNKIKGFRFSLYASENNVITLDNSVFNLSCGNNLLLPSNTILLFEVDFDGVIREVGKNSSLIYTSTPPVDTVTPVGYIDIAGKKIPYFN